MPRPKISKQAILETEVSTKDIAEAKARIKTSQVLVAKADMSKDIVAAETGRLDRIVYEAVIDGKAKYYPVTISTPRKGRFFVMRTYESDGGSRILVSPRDWNESFPFSKGPVLTKYGFANGTTCNVTLKLIDVMIDTASEDVVGVYLVIMTPRFAQMDVDAKKLIKTATEEDVLRVKEEILTHDALTYKFQLTESEKRAETYRSALVGRDMDITKIAEDFAAPIIETTLGALSATEKMFERWQKSNEPWWIRYRKPIIIIMVAGLLLFIASRLI
jgi:hypothetical protein